MNTTRRRTRPLAAIATVVTLMVSMVMSTGIGIPASAAAAAPGWHAGACTGADANAVTVVVDYQDLGGATLIRCAVNLASGATGRNALTAAAITVTPAGPGFVCRLQGRPSATQVVPIPANPNYTEKCDGTPPSTAYWSYWWAAPGGRWTYSSVGFMSNRVKIGGFEGWSFSHNRTATTNPPPRVTPAAPLRPAPTPTITGTARVGAVLAVHPGTWGPAPVTLRYGWRANNVAISGATASTFKLTAAQLGKTITVAVTATKTGFATATRTSAATVRVAAGVLSPAPIPTIAGTARVGSTLTARPGAWGPAPVTLRYTWRLNGVAISGATAATYKITTGARGKRVTVAVTATKSGYTSVVRGSAATAVVT